MRGRRGATALAVLVFVVALVAVGCGDGDDGSVTSGTSRPSRSSGAGSTAASSYVGLGKRAAIAKADAAGVTWRITREDDEVFMVTQDYVPDRVNFEIDDGTVTKATFG